MAQHRRALVGAQGEVLKNGGKIAHVYIAVTGDRVWNLREVDVNGDVKYKLSAGVNIPHTDLHIPFKTALFAEVVSGSTGEINVVVE